MLILACSVRSVLTADRGSGSVTADSGDRDSKSTYARISPSFGPAAPGTGTLAAAAQDLAGAGLAGADHLPVGPRPLRSASRRQLAYPSTRHTTTSARGRPPCSRPCLSQPVRRPARATGTPGREVQELPGADGQVGARDPRWASDPRPPRDPKDSPDPQRDAAARASWWNPVERWLAEITRRRTRRGTFRSPQVLEAAIRESLPVDNEDPQPFLWTQSADDILKSLKSYGEGISGEAHQGRSYEIVPKPAGQTAGSESAAWVSWSARRQYESRFVPVPPRDVPVGGSLASRIVPTALHTHGQTGTARG